MAPFIGARPIAKIANIANIAKIIEVPANVPIRTIRQF